MLDDSPTDPGLVERYRKRAEEIRAYASGMPKSEERATLLEMADEYEWAAVSQEVRAYIQRTVH